MPLLKCACICFCSRRWLETHLRNDWLAGVWFFYWGSWVATIACFACLLGALAVHSWLQCFLFGVS
jgi:hypothetical protein